MHITGTLAGKGMMSRLSYPSADATTYAVALTSGVTVNAIAFSDNATGGVVSINAPTGGVGQFKGLTQSAVEDKYVSVVCNGLQPNFWTDAWKILSTGVNHGFMTTCWTGIA